jgi:hypothetical protein
MDYGRKVKVRVQGGGLWADPRRTMARPKNTPAAVVASPTPRAQADLKECGITPGEVIWEWPGVRESALHEAESRRMFQRTLACWATDVLRLKRRGLDVPVSRRMEPRQAMPMTTPMRKAA